jgi:hypothetical protein
MDTLPDFPSIIGEDQPTIGVCSGYKVEAKEDSPSKVNRYNLR